MNKYVVGFLFDGNGYVALINKNRPEWQKGRINGIGGHIEDGETPYKAMVREFQEEAGLKLKWQQFALIKGDSYKLYCFTATNKKGDIKQMTDEIVGWYLIDELPENIIPNLRWMIPMANYKLDIKAVVYHTNPEC